MYLQKHAAAVTRYLDIMTRRPWFLGMVALSLVAAACKKKDATSDNSGSGSASATGSSQVAAPDAAAPTPTPDAAAQAAAALAAGAMSTPFASIEAYCADVSARFVKDDCWSQADNIEMCSCDAATKDDLGGNVKAGGTSANLTGAHLVVVADNAADYAQCSLALQLANGWHIVHEAFPCGAAPVSHDGGISVTVNRFNITADNKLKLAWTTDDGKAKKAYSLECTASAPAAATCTAPAAK